MASFDRTRGPMLSTNRSYPCRPSCRLFSEVEEALNLAVGDKKQDGGAPGAQVSAVAAVEPLPLYLDDVANLHRAGLRLCQRNDAQLGGRVEGLGEVVALVELGDLESGEERRVEEA